MKFPKIPQEYQDLAQKIWQKVRQPISFVVSLMAKKFTPVAISVGLAFLLIEKTYNLIVQYVRLVLEKEVAIASSGVVLTAIISIIIAIFTYSLITIIATYITNFIKRQIAEINAMWQLSKRASNNSSEMQLTEPIVDKVEKIEMINYEKSIEMIKNSHYGIESKRKAINLGKLKETGGYVLKESYGMQAFLNGTKEVRIKTAEEKAEESKEMMLYDILFQEFVGNSSYIKSNIEIVKNDLANFLRIKEIEIQNQVFAKAN
jgi:hypothetical protein